MRTKYESFCLKRWLLDACYIDSSPNFFIGCFLSPRYCIVLWICTEYRFFSRSICFRGFCGCHPVCENYSFCIESPNVQWFLILTGLGLNVFEFHCFPNINIDITVLGSVHLVCTASERFRFVASYPGSSLECII